jgi:aconitase A
MADPSPYEALRKPLKLADGSQIDLYDLHALPKLDLPDAARLPNSVKVLLEAALRTFDGLAVTEDTVRALADWQPTAADRPEVAFEFERNRERYEFLRWGQTAFDNFASSPPPPASSTRSTSNTSPASSRASEKRDGETVAFPDTLVGTDSHTTMINGLGVVGWGVGGIEAEAVMLGQPIYMLTPEVVGFRLTGSPPRGRHRHRPRADRHPDPARPRRRRQVRRVLRPRRRRLSLADRATIANMAPEYGATMGFFPVDDETLAYLRTGRDPAQVDLVERYCKAQGLFRTDDAPEPAYNDVLELDLATVEPSLAGPKRPQDRVPCASQDPSKRSTATLAQAASAGRSPAAAAPPAAQE